MIGAAALVCGVVVCVVVLGSDHQQAKAAFAIFGPAVGWGFIGTGLWAWRREPANRTGKLMVALGFAWLLSTLEAANSPLVYTVAITVGSLWGSFFAHLGLSFPSGRVPNRFDRGLVVAGYLIFPLANVPALFFAGPRELDCAGCPANVLLVRADDDLAGAAARVRRGPVRGPLPRGPGPGGPALAPLERARAPAADAGLRLLAAHVPARDRGSGRRRRRGLLGRVHRRLADAVRLPGRPAAQPRVRARRRAARPPGGAARLARADRRGRRRRAAAAGARPARRRAVAARGAGPPAPHRAHAGRAGIRSSRRCSTAPRRSSRPACPSCASSRAASIRRCSPTGGSSRRCRRSCRARPCPWRSRRSSTRRCRTRSRARPTSSSPRRSRTWPSTRRRRRPPSWCGGSTGASRSTSPTTASAAPTPRTGSGLRGLADRLAALDGTLSLESPAGGGTRLHAEIPARAQTVPSGGSAR